MFELGKRGEVWLVWGRPILPPRQRRQIRKSLAEVLLGRDPRQIDRLWADMLLKVGTMAVR